MKLLRPATNYIAYALIALVIALVPLMRPNEAIAADTGEYPWADATTLNANTYDWGYLDCKPAMQQANTCGLVRYGAGQAYFVSDPWRYALRNCTSYVAWRIHHEFGASIPGWGNANSWDNAAARAGYRVDNQPSVGDVAVWEGYYGHVAYVVAVNPDGSVNVEQYNRAGTGLFSRESRVRANSYIHLGLVKPAVQTVAAPAPPVVVAEQPKPVEAPPVRLVDPPARQTPLPPADNPDPLASTSETDYVIALNPNSQQTNIYAIQHSSTATGKVEVSISNSRDKTSGWQVTHTTPILNHGVGESSYTIADHNSDGQLDLYQVKYAASTSNRTEVTVLDGATGYKDILGSWRTSEATHPPTEASYSVADYDGDGALDLYKIQKQSPTLKQTVKVINGAKGFEAVTGSWETDDSQPTTSADYLVGDYDRDGKADIYQVGKSETEPTQIQAKVFDAARNYRSVYRDWVIGRTQ